MSTDAQRIVVAFNRFGFGPRPGDLAKTSDPHAVLFAELEAPDGATFVDDSLPRSAAAVQTVFADQERKRLEREQRARLEFEQAGMPAPAVAPLLELKSPPEPSKESQAMMSGGPPMKPPPSPEQQIFRAEASARLRR